MRFCNSFSSFFSRSKVELQKLLSDIPDYLKEETDENDDHDGDNEPFTSQSRPVPPTGDEIAQFMEPSAYNIFHMVTLVQHDTHETFTKTIMVHVITELNR